MRPPMQKPIAAILPLQLRLAAQPAAAVRQSSADWSKSNACNRCHALSA